MPVPVIAIPTTTPVVPVTNSVVLATDAALVLTVKELVIFQCVGKLLVDSMPSKFSVTGVVVGSSTCANAGGSKTATNTGSQMQNRAKPPERKEPFRALNTVEMYIIGLISWLW